MCYDSSLSDNHRGHCAIAPPREAPSLRLRQSDSRVCASLCDSVPVCSVSALPESVATTRRPSDRRVGGDPESPSPDPESPSPDPESPSPDPESPSPGPRVRRRDPAGWPGFHVSDSSKRGHLQPSPTGLQRCTGGCSGAQVAASGSVALRQLRVRYSLRGLRCGDGSAGHGSGGTTAALRRQWPRERDGPAPTRADVNGAASADGSGGRAGPAGSPPSRWRDGLVVASQASLGWSRWTPAPPPRRPPPRCARALRGVSGSAGGCGRRGRGCGFARSRWAGGAGPRGAGGSRSPVDEPHSNSAGVARRWRGGGTRARAVARSVLKRRFVAQRLGPWGSGHSHPAQRRALARSTPPPNGPNRPNAATAATMTRRHHAKTTSCWRLSGEPALAATGRSDVRTNPLRFNCAIGDYTVSPHRLDESGRFTRATPCRPALNDESTWRCSGSALSAAAPAFLARTPLFQRRHHAAHAPRRPRAPAPPQFGPQASRRWVSPPRPPIMGTMGVDGTDDGRREAGHRRRRGVFCGRSFAYSAAPPVPRVGPPGAGPCRPAPGP